VPTDPALLAQASLRPSKVTETRSVINPAFTLALGVAGLVAAAVAFYQLTQVLSTRPAPPTIVAASTPVPSPGVAAPVPSPAAQAKSVPQAVTSTQTQTGNSYAAAPASAPTGWVTLEAPIELQIFEAGRLRGTTRNARVVLPAGSHELLLVNEEYEIRQRLSISVASGQPANATVTLPTGSLSVNALPWADVWIDGNPVGTTPLANLSVPIGAHEVVWKHPTLGERRQSVVAKAKTPARIGVDFAK
jgi:hypothetical protein